MPYNQLPTPENQPNAEAILQAGAELLQHFGVEADPHDKPEQFTAALSQIDPRYQGGRELVRFQLESDQTAWPDKTKQVIMRAAEGMRMLEPETPLVGDFDAVIALGGARQSNLDRTDYAAQAAHEGSATFRELVVAGSTRPLNEAEQQNTRNYADGATTEYDLCAGAAQTVANNNPDLTISAFQVDNPKAGTPAVLEAVLSDLQVNGRLPANARVAAVTTQIYQASTELDLARVAKQFGIAETFTAGNPSDPKIVASRTPATYLRRSLADAASSHERRTSWDVVRTPTYVSPPLACYFVRFLKGALFSPLYRHASLGAAIWGGAA